jgi:hypothetical protein
MPAATAQTVSVVGIDIGKNSFYIIGLNDRGANTGDPNGPLEVCPLIRSQTR